MNYYPKAEASDLQHLPEGLYAVCEGGELLRTAQPHFGLVYNLLMVARVRPPYPHGHVPPGVQLEDRPDGKVVVFQWMVTHHREIEKGYLL